jgi:hypothetical protein
MIAALLLAAATPMTAIDAERAFAADAQKLGQWTAFRKWAADDAEMFTPQPVKAQQFLKDRKDPPVAVFWWPGRSFASCDGTYAVNTGPWVREWGKSVGYFTTVWRREGDRWRWVYDNGNALNQARAEGGDIKPYKATCPATHPVPPPPQPEMPADVKWGRGASKDGTLNWFWSVDAKGAQQFRASIWDGHAHTVLIDDRIAAPAP